MVPEPDAPEHPNAPNHAGVPLRLSESDKRRRTSLRTAMLPILPYLDDDAVIEIMLNADGVVWVEKAGVGMIKTEARMRPDAAETMLKLIAAHAGAELTEREQ
jgi:Flp pilus assembly CpaF family ATPase